MDGIEIIVLEVPPWLIDKDFIALSSFNDPDSLFFAVWAYLIHDEPFHLEMLNEGLDEADKRGLDELTGFWVDEVFMEWETLAVQLRQGQLRNLAGVFYEPLAEALFVVFKERDFDEPFSPATLPAQLHRRPRTLH